MGKTSKLASKQWTSFGEMKWNRALEMKWNLKQNSVPSKQKSKWSGAILHSPINAVQATIHWVTVWTVAVLEASQGKHRENTDLWIIGSGTKYVMCITTHPSQTGLSTDVREIMWKWENGQEDKSPNLSPWWVTPLSPCSMIVCEFHAWVLGNPVVPIG